MRGQQKEEGENRLWKESDKRGETAREERERESGRAAEFERTVEERETGKE